MTSNDLEISAEALVKAWIDSNFKHDKADSTPIVNVERKHAPKALMRIQKMGIMIEKGF